MSRTAAACRRSIAKCRMCPVKLHRVWTTRPTTKQSATSQHKKINHTSLTHLRAANCCVCFKNLCKSPGQPMSCGTTFGVLIGASVPSIKYFLAVVLECRMLAAAKRLQISCVVRAELRTNIWPNNVFPNDKLLWLLYTENLSKYQWLPMSYCTESSSIGHRSAKAIEA